MSKGRSAVSSAKGANFRTGTGILVCDLANAATLGAGIRTDRCVLVGTDGIAPVTAKVASFVAVAVVSVGALATDEQQARRQRQKHCQKENNCFASHGVDLLERLKAASGKAIRVAIRRVISQAKLALHSQDNLANKIIERWGLLIPPRSHHFYGSKRAKQNIYIFLIIV